MSAFLSSILLFLLLISPTKTVAQANLTVAAAADLASLEPDLAAAFHEAPIRFVTEASAVLSQQIENGAPYDVFLSANAAFVEKLASEGKIAPGSVIVYAHGQLGILWREAKRHDLKDLAGPSVRFVAIANPKLAPYGAAAQEALQNAGLWSAVQPKLVYGENVHQALQLFDSGNADAVITAGSLLINRQPSFVPRNLYKPIIQKAGVVAASPNQALAQRFVKFITDPAGQAVFARYGFGSLTQP